jgi:hypothetical protein
MEFTAQAGQRPAVSHNSPRNRVLIMASPPSIGCYRTGPGIPDSYSTGLKNKLLTRFDAHVRQTA